MMDTDSLPQRWRAEAAILRRRGAGLQADVLESCAAELEEFERERALQALTLEQAAEESGYGYSAIEKMVRRGEIENLGEKGRPRVRRADLPRKARRSQAPDLAGTVIAGRIGQRLDKRGAASQNA